MGTQRHAISEGRLWCSLATRMGQEEVWAAVHGALECLRSQPQWEGTAAEYAQAQAHMQILLHLTRPELAAYLRDQLELHYGQQPAAQAAAVAVDSTTQELPSSSGGGGELDVSGDDAATADTSNGGDDSSEKDTFHFGQEDMDQELEQEMARQRCAASVMQAFRTLRLT